MRYGHEFSSTVILKLEKIQMIITLLRSSTPFFFVLLKRSSHGNSNILSMENIEYWKSNCGSNDTHDASV